jgi:hypothetical protein
MKDPVQVEARLGQGCDRRHLAPVMVLPRGQGPEGWTLSWVWLSTVGTVGARLERYPSVVWKKTQGNRVLNRKSLVLMPIDLH